MKEANEQPAIESRPFTEEQLEQLGREPQPPILRRPIELVGQGAMLAGVGGITGINALANLKPRVNLREISL